MKRWEGLLRPVEVPKVTKCLPTENVFCFFLLVIIQALFLSPEENGERKGEFLTGGTCQLE